MNSIFGFSASSLAYTLSIHLPFIFLQMFLIASSPSFAKSVIFFFANLSAISFALSKINYLLALRKVFNDYFAIFKPSGPNYLAASYT